MSVRRRPPVWLAITLGMVLIVCLQAGVMHLFGHPIVGLAAALAMVALLCVWLARRKARIDALYRALAGTVTAYADGDFNFSLRWPSDGALGQLVQAHNTLGDTLRDQRTQLSQRELLLDTVVQNTPIALLLCDPGRRIVLDNLAARSLLGNGQRLEGQHLDALVRAQHASLQEALSEGTDALFVAGDSDDGAVFHLARRHFRLNGRPHELLLLRQMTHELRRQEVQTWKKVIRVISHELNNSLAPIASLAHSSSELLRRGQSERVPQALAVIEERARHLESFLRDYARFAKLPAPQRVPLRWGDVLDHLRQQIAFEHDGHHADDTVRMDAGQMQQAMLNLLKNAHESGSTPADIVLSLRRLPDAWRLDIADRGTGMPQAVLAQALLPFYSTKRNGTGLGLALSREIVEAHGGAIALANREGGGLTVMLTLPD